MCYLFLKNSGTVDTLQIILTQVVLKAAFRNKWLLNAQSVLEKEELALIFIFNIT